MVLFKNCIFIASSGDELAKTAKKHARLNTCQFYETLNQTLFVAFDWRHSLEQIAEQYINDPIKYFVKQSQQQLLSSSNNVLNSSISDEQQQSTNSSSTIIGGGGGELDENCKFYCVIRTTWDYVLHYGDFIKWLKIMNQLGQENKLITFNHPELLMWNSTKRYLFEIQDLWENHSIVPSELVDKSVVKEFSTSANEIIAKYTKKFNCDKLVFKPLISAGSYFTFVVSKREEDDQNIKINDYAKETEKKMDKLLEFFNKEEDKENPDRNIMMVQPFMEEIVNDGEYSFLFINEKPSHMLWKKPKEGDFRVQGDYGGSNTCITQDRFSTTILEGAKRLFDKIKKEKSPNHVILYCRLDVVIDWNTSELKICELELLEPHLYFETINPNDKSVELDCEVKLYSAIVQ